MTKASYLRYSGHLGSILFNISIFGLILLASLCFLPVMYITGLCFLGLIALFTSVFSLGTIWTNNNFKDFMSSSLKLFSSDSLNDFATTIVAYLPLIASITGVLIVLSSIFLFFDRKNPSSKGRLVAIIVIFLIFVILLICIISGVKIGGAQ